MSYQVKLVQFSGPLDLLMQLIERSQLEVTQIDLAEITNQYLQYLSGLDDLEPDELNWFIDLASRLMHLKSSALLPYPIVSETDTELQDLTKQLEEYGRYQLAARHLSERVASSQQSWGRTKITSLPPDRLPLPKLEWQQLEAAFLNALSRMPSTPTVKLLNRSISLPAMITKVKLYVQPTKTAKLSQLLSKVQSRPEIVVLFLALLDLIKAGFLAVAQSSQFADITLTVNPNVSA